VVVTLSNAGYVKWVPLDEYAAQRRGGKGRSATSMKAEDVVDRLLVANTHDTILCFSSRGRVYWLRVFQIPQASRSARGRPIVNLLPLEEGERIQAILPLADLERSGHVLIATARGLVKKTPLADFSRPRASGIIAIDLLEGDHVVGVALTDGDSDIMLASSDGKMIRFAEQEVRPMGRVARGVRGIRLGPGARVVSLLVGDGELVLTATANGFGKCTPVAEYRPQGRGGRGLISIQPSARNGEVVRALRVDGDDEVVLITDGGKLVRTRVAEISVLGRNTQGVKLMSLAPGERLAGMQRVVDED